jgi:hypothetical protein
MEKNPNFNAKDIRDIKKDIRDIKLYTNSRLNTIFGSTLAISEIGINEKLAEQKQHLKILLDNFVKYLDQNPKDPEVVNAMTSLAKTLNSNLKMYFDNIKIVDLKGLLPTLVPLIIASCCIQYDSNKAENDQLIKSTMTFFINNFSIFFSENFFSESKELMNKQLQGDKSYLKIIIDNLPSLPSLPSLQTQNNPYFRSQVYYLAFIESILCNSNQFVFENDQDKKSFSNLFKANSFNNQNGRTINIIKNIISYFHDEKNPNEKNPIKENFKFISRLNELDPKGKNQVQVSQIQSKLFQSVLPQQNSQTNNNQTNPNTNVQTSNQNIVQSVINSPRENEQLSSPRENKQLTISSQKTDQSKTDQSKTDQSKSKVTKNFSQDKVIASINLINAIINIANGYEKKYSSQEDKDLLLITLFFTMNHESLLVKDNTKEDNTKEGNKIIQNIIEKNTANIDNCIVVNKVKDFIKKIIELVYKETILNLIDEKKHDYTSLKNVIKDKIVSELKNVIKDKIVSELKSLFKENIIHTFIDDVCEQKINEYFQKKEKEWELEKQLKEEKDFKVQEKIKALRSILVELTNNFFPDTFLTEKILESINYNYNYYETNNDDHENKKIINSFSAVTKIISGKEYELSTFFDQKNLKESEVNSEKVNSKKRDQQLKEFLVSFSEIINKEIYINIFEIKKEGDSYNEDLYSELASDLEKKLGFIPKNKNQEKINEKEEEKKQLIIDEKPNPAVNKPEKTIDRPVEPKKGWWCC